MSHFATKKEWKVYYNNGYWKSSTNRTHHGTELAIKKRFMWGDEIWHVPSVYLCSKGLVVDYCVEVETEKVKVFLDEWKSLNIDFYSRYTLNGKAVRQKMGSRLSYVPERYLPEGVENPPESLEIIEHYKLDPTKAWSFHRHSCPWATQRKPKEIESLVIRLERQPETIEGIHFKNPAIGDMIVFEHPITEAEHKLTVCEYEQQELETRAFAHEEYEFPTHHTAMTYTLEPPLAGTSFSVRDCLQNETARYMPKKKYEPEASCAAACIGIIGGADGPTAIVVSPKNYAREFHIALSALHFEPTTDVEWKIEFREKMKEDIEVTII